MIFLFDILLGFLVSFFIGTPIAGRYAKERSLKYYVISLGVTVAICFPIIILTGLWF